MPENAVQFSSKDGCAYVYRPDEKMKTWFFWVSAYTTPL
jgi:hypothetical protein